jgi:hypothetical protein
VSELDARSAEGTRAGRRNLTTGVRGEAHRRLNPEAREPIGTNGLGRSAWTGIVAAFLTALCGTDIGAQQGKLEVARPGDTVLATPQGRYSAGALHRLFLGDGNRDLWSTPVRVRVLDLDGFAGGLTPVRLGGGLQTRSLRLEGADGVIYNFRSLDKDASRTLDPELRRSIAARVLQDQIASLMPLGALVVSPLLEAANVLHADPDLVVMPTDPELGEYEEEFGGLLGFIEERPNEGPDGLPGFAGSSLVVGSERFLELLEEDPRYQVNERAYLRARIIDLFVGDWDRHPDQWRWAAFEDDGVTSFEPIPRDRDWALARMNGLLPWAASWPWPHYKGFSTEYHSVFNATWSGRALDRRLLAGTARDVWDEIALDVQTRLSDGVIEDAVSRLPAAYFEKTGAYLIRALKNRRDDLPGQVDAFYRQLAGEVDVHATDERDLAVIEHASNRSTLSLYELGEEGEARGDPYLQRTFDPSETNEIRVFLRGDDDRAVVQGDGKSGVGVRIIGGGSDDRLEDRSSGGRVHFYDHRGDNEFITTSRTHVDESDYEEPEDPGSATHQAPPRDWGSRTIPLPVLEYDTDVGVMAGVGFVRTGYAFRYFPYHTRLRAGLAFGSSADRFRGTLDWHFPLLGPDLMGRIRGRWSGAEFNRWFGFGNSTSSDGPEERFLAQRRDLDLEALTEFHPFEDAALSFGTLFRSLRPYANVGTLLNEVEPYGDGDFDQIGITGHFTWDGRNRPRAATRGLHLTVNGRYVPAVLDVTDAFGGVRGALSGHLSPDLPLDPTLSVRVGGEKVWGAYPYFEAAYLGGAETVRGVPKQRFAGDASIFTNTELRIFLGELFVLLPGDFGVFGLMDLGRVYYENETSDDWHEAYGGGVWLAFIDRAYTMSLAVASGAEETGVYLKAGFMF